MARLAWKEFLVYEDFHHFVDDMRASFKLSDSDGNGYIGICEWKPILMIEYAPYSYEGFNERDVIETFIEADVDKDGQINFVEFVRF